MAGGETGMDRPVVAVVDYHKGNLSSVARGLARAGAAALVTDDPERIRAADGIVLPGVGSFYDAVTFMRDHGQDVAVRDAVATGEGTPFLGICLGLQLLFERGDERTHEHAAEDAWAEGLGVIAGSVTRLSSERLKVPHVGWDQIHLTEHGRSCPLLAGVAEGANVYFTHSYAVSDDVDPAIVATRTHYTRSFASVVWHGDIYGCQFHPEKSSRHGHEILRNFVGIVERKRGARA